MKTIRRRLLQSVAGTASLSMADVSWLRGLPYRRFLAAILEDAALVSPDFQPHLLAASVHYFHGGRSPDTPVVQQAREALRKT